MTAPRHKAKAAYIKDMEHEEFARVYLEEEQRGSNIYFAHAALQPKEKKEFTVYYHMLPGRVQYRRLGFGEVIGWIGTAAFSFLIAAFFLVYGQKIVSSPDTLLVSDAITFEQFAAAGDSFFNSRFSEAIAHANEASLKLESAQSSGALARVTRSLLSSLPFVGSAQENDAARLEQSLSEAAQAAIGAIDTLSQIPRASLVASEQSSGKAVLSLGAVVNTSLLRMKDAKEKIVSAQEVLKSASPGSFSGVEQGQLDTLSAQLLLAGTTVDHFISSFDMISWALGVDHPRRFLILVQDTSVRRATGGVIGSYGIMETSGGAITKFSFDDVYNVDGQLTANIVPPTPLQKVTTSWALRNANWFLDFPLSAQKIAYMYSKAGGRDIDGVITVDEKMFARLLDVTGPIAAPHHEGVIISSFNIGELTSARTELDFGKSKDSGESLAVLEDVTSAMVSALEQSSQKTVGAALSAMQASLNQKDVLLWFPDQTREGFITGHGWDGGIAETPQSDYLAVVSSDIGPRPDYIDIPQILKEMHIAPDGTITDTVVVQFKSRGANADPSRYIRVYTPSGSILEAASGNAALDIAPPINYTKENFIFDRDVAASQASLTTDAASHTDVFTESGKTVFGGWLSENGARLIYTYTLPFGAQAGTAPTSFSSVFQKQPGADAALHFTVFPPDGTEAVPDPSSNIPSSDYSGDLLTDRSFMATLK